MRRVLDASVAFKWVVPETDSDRAIRLRDDYRNQRVELISPNIFGPEVAHSLTRAERQLRIAVSQSIVLLADVLSTPPVFYPAFPILGRACEISSQLRIGVYDCLYVALAEREGCDLVTADTKLIGKLQKQFPFIVDLASLP